MQIDLRRRAKGDYDIELQEEPYDRILLTKSEQYRWSDSLNSSRFDINNSRADSGGSFYREL